MAPTPDLADAWVGEYSGTGSFALSNGVSGSDRPTTIVIEAIDPKRISITARLVYGEGRNDFTTAIALLEPRAADRLLAEYRAGTTRTVYSLVKEDGKLTGSIVSSTLRVNGSWTEDQRMIVDVERQ